MRKEALGIVHEVLHRDDHKVPLAKARVRKRQLATGVGLALHPEQVAVDGAGPMTLLAGRARAAKLLLDVEKGIDEDERSKLGANFCHGIGDGHRDAIGRVGLVGAAHGRDARERYGVDERGGALEVLEAIAHV